MQALRDKVAFVTGGSRGIGAAIVKQLVEDGAAIAFTYRENSESAQALVDEVKRNGGRAIAIQSDSADPNALISAINETANTFGRLDIVVNNAGVFPYGKPESFTIEDIDRTLAVHTRAAFVSAQAAIPHMGAGGRIISIGSCFVERVPVPGISLYAMSKSALTGLTKGLARDLGPLGITVNIVHPGPTDTDMNPANAPGAEEEKAWTALGQYGRGEDIAAAVAYLAGESGNNTTGTAICVDGGYAA
ncbi:MAG: SDR family oxidoreductase [Halomonas sp.]|uniref:SDR family oxidoreductase n=1 Tax=Halomonas sulfidivorans TaxID=2733488 RepID=A0ABX7WFN7_9GAMM|nr:SDR family oxidoreductase [Halomonas sulfidivorans]MDX5379615.1 SDR family oxidoreductase [Halomonas sp.]QTP57928.1 SDR family oxidoreductase [Halomonas sulfidivorans]